MVVDSLKETSPHK